MSSMTPLHRAARRYAEAGIPVFPCEEGGKMPATANGFHDATTDIAQIDAWWGGNGDLNIGLCPDDAGWCVVDLDPPVGLNNWQDLCRLHDYTAETYIVQTPRGGEHWYFKGALPSSVGKLAEKIDTRGIGGYVLVPPSIVNGKTYRVLHDTDLADCPPWVGDAVKARTQEAKASVRELDLPGSIARARHLLLQCVGRGDVAVEGRGGDDRTYRLACELLNLGVSADCAGSLLVEIWNPKCVPPWDEGELRAKVENAAAYMQNEAGAWGVAPATEVFAGALDHLPATSEPASRSKFYAEDESEQDTAPPVQWVIKDVIPDNTFVLIVGAKGTFKSFVAHHLLLSIASGRDTGFGKPERSGPVFYGAWEGRNQIKRERRQAWKLSRNIGDEKIPVYVMRAPLVISEEECEEFREQIRVRLRQGSDRIAGIVLDTVAKCMVGLDENSAEDMGRFVHFCDGLVDEFQCPVIALHHTKKDGSKGGRGSGAAEAGAGSVLDTERSDKRPVLAVSVRFHKDADERDEPWTFQGKVVGPSLVFFPTTTEEHKMLTASEDDVSREKVGQVLVKLGAYGEEKGVTTNVLAQELLPQLASESQEARQAAVSQFSKRIGAMSRGKLRAYNVVKGAGILWCLPAREVH